MRLRMKSKEARLRPKLNVILGRMDRGEITPKQAHYQMQEYDKKQYSKLDRFLEAIAG